jgi:hypothetical protein
MSEKNKSGPEEKEELPDRETLDAQQGFISELLVALDSRRAAVDSRSTVVFAISGGIFALFVSEIDQQGLFYPGNTCWKLIFCVIIVLLLLAASILGLSLVAPIARSKSQRRADQTRKPLSWFYLIAELSEPEYRTTVIQQTRVSLLSETCAQVSKVSRLLRKRYKRLAATCNVLYAGITVIGIYLLLLLTIGGV